MLHHHRHHHHYHLYHVLFILINILSSSFVISTISNDYFSLCLMAKVTNPHEIFDVREFVDYHIKIGTNKIYLFDDNSPSPFNTTLTDHIDSGVVHYTYLAHNKSLNKRKAQYRVYDTCLREHLRKHVWMGFIDLDEFIVIADKKESLRSILQPFEHYGGVGINLKIFGSSGHIARPSGGVLGNYRYCHPSALIKSIVRSGRVKGTGGTVHYFKYKQGFYDVDLRGRNITASWNVKGRVVRNKNNQRGEDLRFSKLYINHYVTKSWEDYTNKRRRRAPNGDIRSIKFFNETNRMATFDCGILKMPQSVS